MTLVDHEIEAAVAHGELEIEPLQAILESGRLQPCSVDLLLADEFLRPLPGLVSFATESKQAPKHELKKASTYILPPKSFALGSTVERVRLGPRLRASVEGKSTLGRCGLSVHVTAGFIDPGFNGRITLELVNHTESPIILAAGMKICQLALVRLASPPNRVYGHAALGSHYQNQQGVVGPRWG